MEGNLLETLFIRSSSQTHHFRDANRNFLPALSGSVYRRLGETFPPLRRTVVFWFWPYSLLLPRAFSRLSRQPSAEAAAPSADASFSFSRASLRFSEHTPSVRGHGTERKGQRSSGGASGIAVDYETAGIRSGSEENSCDLSGDRASRGTEMFNWQILQKVPLRKQLFSTTTT